MSRQNIINRYMGKVNFIFNKRTLFVFLALILCFMAPKAVKAQTTVYFEIPEDPVEVDSTFSVTLNITDVTDMESIGSYIYFNDEKIVYNEEDVKRGELFADPDCEFWGELVPINDDYDFIDFYADSYFVAPISGSGTVAIFYFTANGPGEVSLTFSDFDSFLESDDEDVIWQNSNTITVSEPDEDPPADIIDLAIATTAATTATLTWTAPGDDGNQGTATVYDIRYATSTISTSTWDSLLYTRATTTPRLAGSTENYTVTGLNGDTTYYFAVKTSDETPNESELSNIVSTSTLDIIAPERISDFVTTGAGLNSVSLRWTAPGDNGDQGTATKYDIRYSTAAIDDEVSWNAANSVDDEPEPSPAGTEENYIVEDLFENTHYFFAMKAYDEVNNASELSQLVSRWTLDGTAPVPDNGSPTGALDSGATEATLSLTTDEIAECRYATTTDVIFADMTGIFDNTSSTTHSTLITGLSDGNTYNFYIRCQDESGNATEEDYIITFSVSNPAPYCGDGSCNGSETCSTCPTDCGSCGGGGGGGGSYTPPSDTTPPGQPADVKADRNGNQIALSWTNPSDSDFDKATIIRTTEPIDDYLTYEALKEIGEVIYEGADELFADNEIEVNLTYYYAVFTSDKKLNYSKAIIIQKNSTIKKENQASGPIKNLANIESGLVNQISHEEAVGIYHYNRRIELSDVTEKLYLLIVDKSPHDLGDQDKFAIARFIHNGTPTTIVLGAGERTGVLNSYLSAFNKLPMSESEWQDIIKIANGRWPTERKEEAEVKAQDTFFLTVYKREPNMDNPHDNAAVTVITYGLRPADRNMDSERAAISIFKAIFMHNPVSAIDWDIVRAIAYSGAVR